ncbi:type III pantothenate kinase [Marinobacterium rhizophilum]|uniref:Type III pantothenate kinase n=1 Tax=Marinobacterium rhizophilum TaxID=420402 RepID=A0ABY5HFF5_9GAMM|nr:type III pantothenate kinase [Marinobacterium rhizophilum]UTW11020.1 type III pantothenate kinase [Marinobacterium rhizophilum]
MILEIDIGNTFLKWRYADAERGWVRGRLLGAQLDETQFACWPDEVAGVRVACVAGVEMAALVSRYCQARWKLTPEFARVERHAAGVSNSYADPSRMGVDRWLGMLAAYNQVKGAVCVVDCGSAITIDFVSADGTHSGGYIVPGVRLMTSSLLSNTARVVADQGVEQFDMTPGTHTSAAVFHGINFVLDAIAQRLLQQLAADYPSAQLLVTGGDGELFARLAGRGEYCPDLVLDGLHWALA